MRFRRQELWVVAAGALGLAAATAAACSSDASDDGSTTSNTGASGGSNGEGGSSGNGADGSGEGGAGAGAVDGCTSDAATEANTAAVVEAANALLAALTSAQQTEAQYDLSLANAQVWSNFPTTFVQRNGVRIGDMSAGAQAAAEALVAVAAGATGTTLFEELRAADQYLAEHGGQSSDYGEGLYYFSIHGTPSATDPWMLQVGGHHLAYNFLYNGPCTSATPLFDGAEPMDWTDEDGVHAPLDAQRSTMVDLLASVGSIAEAKLSGTFNDLIAGPAGGGPGQNGGGDAKYPDIEYPTGTEGRGVSVATLDDSQRALVEAAIEAWVDNVADPVATSLLADYESDAALDETWVGYAGSADLTTQGSYVRIDGPRVWIEVTVQGGIVLPEVHFHTIWRDKVADYGAEFTQ